eukprot:CAMPEP_0175045590 /NCGR_PEP_ID=MMETSP0052_2-20121109/4517_1 /TAXON_ID=51329 ORGANISM="Polytomella parva, Strain SAG 63-3" /NCGR_SAMPLE_ID=MMETSP0052_2 /ASSEMBLY_ACC=CAM_ASM_000194 /LENGTH=287 /DNA_ID=CAMNT_0016309157 /DNA_START=22 /DNA_END=881 /DNA_ORIENTATION=+
MSKKNEMNKAIDDFSANLLRFASQIQTGTEYLKDNVTFPKKHIIGVREFRSTLEGIEQRASAVAGSLTVIDKLSTNTLSLEELLGHCVTLYDSNRRAIQNLEKRLEDYGYRHDPNVPIEPIDPLASTSYTSHLDEAMEEADVESDVISKVHSIQGREMGDEILRGDPLFEYQSLKSRDYVLNAVDEGIGGRIHSTLGSSHNKGKGVETDNTNNSKLPLSNYVKVKQKNKDSSISRCSVSSDDISKANSPEDINVINATVTCNNLHVAEKKIEDESDDDEDDVGLDLT